MTKSQCYIGTPNGVVLCVNSRNKYGPQGKFYHAYSKEGKDFLSFDDLIFKLEKFFDEINFPHPTTNRRVFRNGKLSGIKQQLSGIKQRERTRIMKDEELLRKYGDLGSFIIRVQHRQNSSWQGRLTWVEKNETINFRSIWEMVKLIESALESVGEPMDDHKNRSWSKAEDDKEDTRGH